MIMALYPRMNVPRLPTKLTTKTILLVSCKANRSRESGRQTVTVQNDWMLFPMLFWLYDPLKPIGSEFQFQLTLMYLHWHQTGVWMKQVLALWMGPTTTIKKNQTSIVADFAGLHFKELNRTHLSSSFTLLTLRAPRMFRVRPMPRW